jgi:tryptophan synthase alpha chain
MSRIQTRFQALAGQNRKALIAFITAGDPAPDMTVPLMHALVAGGVDIIDPMAEGPVIQRASERALAHGIGTRHVLDYVRQFRATDNDTPIVLMGYANPIERMGQANFVAAAREVGVDGTIVVDYPPEECEEFALAMRSAGMDTIFLLAPTSTPERIEQVAKVGAGFCYYVSLKGVTGAGHIDIEDVRQRLAAIREHVKLPIGVGFGIRDAETAKAIASVADGVVIGSRIIQEMEAAPRDEAIAVAHTFVANIRQALDNKS